MTLQVSIVIPVLYEAGHLAVKLQALQRLKDRYQLLLLDGGSHDASPVIAEPLMDKVANSPRVRAIQMNYGLAQADQVKTRLQPVLTAEQSTSYTPMNSLSVLFFSNSAVTSTKTVLNAVLLNLSHCSVILELRLPAEFIGMIESYFPATLPGIGILK